MISRERWCVILCLALAWSGSWAMAAPDAAEVVSNAYEQVLEREPDVAGAAFHVAELQAGRLNEAELRRTLAASPEGRALERARRARWHLWGWVGVGCLAGWGVVWLMGRVRVRTALVPGLLAGVLLAGLTSVVRERLVPYGADRSRAMWRLTGDEPTYLVTAQAIASGHGEDILPVTRSGSYSNFIDRVNWDEHYATWDYYSYFKQPRLLDRAEWWGTRQIVHRPPLLSLLAAPFAFLSSNVRWWVLAVQGGLLALAGGLLVVWLGRGRPTLLGCVALVFAWGNLPVLYYSAQLYPEVLCGVLLVWGVVLATQSRSWLRMVGYVLLQLPLIGTPRVGVGVLAGLVILSVLAVRGRRWGELFVMGGGLALFFGYNLFVWGWFTPPNPDESSPISWLRVPQGLVLSLFSRDVGLFWLAPVLVASLPALYAYSRRLELQNEAWVWGALFAGVLLVVAAFPNYRAGACPAGRYQVIPAMLLALPLLRVLGYGDGWARSVRWVLYTLGPLSFMSAVWVGLHPAWWHTRYHPLFNEPAVRWGYGSLFSPENGWSLVGFFLLLLLLSPVLAAGWRAWAGGRCRNGAHGSQTPGASLIR